VADADYRVWQQVPVTVAGTAYVVVTKPGLFAFGRTDPATVLLAERAVVKRGEAVVQMNCGSGLFGIIAANRHGAARVVLTDRNVVSIESARRSLAVNEVANGEVFVGHGSAPLPRDLRADVVAIRIPQEKLALLQLMHDAFEILHTGGRCYLAGATNEGAKTAAKTLEQLFGNAGVLAHDSGHRLVVAHKRSEAPASLEGLDSPYLARDVFHQLDATLRGRRFSLFTRPGVFSWDHVDEASELLATEMIIQPGESVLDLGCGYGTLGIVAAALSGTGRVRMVDADSEAVRCAATSANAAGLANASVLMSDVASAVSNERFDVVVTNPPFHIGKATELDVPLEFIREAWEVLHSGGRMYLVANRTLPYERAIKHRFGNIMTVHDGRRFKVLSATRLAG
jgi:16S rRNA (guanine1207-N2)-methyltransferase